MSSALSGTSGERRPSPSSHPSGSTSEAKLKMTCSFVAHVEKLSPAQHDARNVTVVLSCIILAVRLGIRYA